jgi:hypothetical protein
VEGPREGTWGQEKEIKRRRGGLGKRRCGCEGMKGRERKGGRKGKEKIGEKRTSE